MVDSVRGLASTGFLGGAGRGRAEAVRGLGMLERGFDRALVEWGGERGEVKELGGMPGGMGIIVGADLGEAVECDEER